ncbi:MAG: TolC family protein [Gammaproteobacteria bacterium]|nr:TolC family protein [Gammaproteobacteria bacterium]
MKYKFIAFACATFWVTIKLAVADDALTLDEYFVAALKRSEVVAIQSELIRQAEERYHQANSTLLPTVNASASYTWQDPTPAGEFSTSISPNRQSLAKISATQPLFRGFREFAGLRQTKALLGAQNEDYLNARIQLFKDVAQNFFNILSIQQDLQNLEEEIKQNVERESELKDRARIGRSRSSETLSVQSTIGTLRAQVEQLRGQLQNAREAFTFLSGLTSSATLNDSESLPSSLAPLEEYLARLNLRPDIKAAQTRVNAAQENVSVARGAHWPSLDLNANRYLARTGNLKDVTWDVQLALTVPIYSGGLLQSKVNEALSQRTQAELSASQVTRQAEQEIRSLYQNIIFDQTQLQALEKATAAAKDNYAAQRREYRLGLVTNLDVLQALTAFQENQRALDRARYTAKLDYAKLQAATVERKIVLEAAGP